MSAPSKILLKGSSVSNKIPALSSLELRELAVNTSDGKIFTKTSANVIVSFLNSSEAPLVLNQSLSSITPQFGSNSASGVFGAVLNGFNNDVSGSGSTVANGENNDILSDYSFIGSGLNNSISLTADYGAILGGSNNTLNHANSFIIGSSVSSHAENFTYINNLSVLGKIYGDGSELTGVAGSVETNIVSLSVQNLSASNFNVGTSNTETAAFFVGTNSKVGINTEVPTNTLTVSGDVGIFGPLTISSDIEITDFTKGIILRSPNNSRWRVTVTNSGALSSTAL